MGDFSDGRQDVAAVLVAERVAELVQDKNTPARIRAGIVDCCDRGELDAAGTRGVLRKELGLECDDLALARLWASAFTPDEQVLTLI